MRKSSAIGLLLCLLPGLALAGDTAPPPKKKRLTLQDLLKSTTGDSHRSASVAGVRGLDETTAEVDTKARDYAAIDRLEKIVIHEEDVKRFLEEGNLP